jgi:hypothetical protein
MFGLGKPKRTVGDDMEIAINEAIKAGAKVPDAEKRLLIQTTALLNGMHLTWADYWSLKGGTFDTFVDTFMGMIVTFYRRLATDYPGLLSDLKRRYEHPEWSAEGAGLFERTFVSVLLDPDAEVPAVTGADILAEVHMHCSLCSVLEITPVKLSAEVCDLYARHKSQLVAEDVSVMLNMTQEGSER